MKWIPPFSLVLICIQFYSCTTTVHVASEPVVNTPPGASYQTFYDELSPYGHWVNNPGYGYVWMPAVDPGFRPYATNGHWVYSEAGWTWVSGYPWGWAAFHYGRWFYEDGFGWMWVPGHEWAPAWVSWRRGTDVYGWAPLSPGISASISFSSYDPPAHYWCFVPHQYVTSPHVNNYYVEQTKNVTIIKNTTIINNTTVNNYGSNNSTNINSNNNNNNNNNNSNNRNNNNTSNSNNGNYSNNGNNSNNSNNRNNRPMVYAAGPDKNEVEQVTNTHIQPVSLREGNKPGNEQAAGNGQLVVYRPKITPATDNAQNKPAPAKIESLKEIKPVAPPLNNMQPASSSPANNVNMIPVKREPPVQAQTQSAQHTQNFPAVNNDAGKPINKINNPEAPVKKDQPVNVNKPDNTVNKPVSNPPKIAVKNSPANNKNTVPVKDLGKMQSANNPANPGKPANIKVDNNMNQHKPAPPSPKKITIPQPPVKTEGDKINKADGNDKKKKQE